MSNKDKEGLEKLRVAQGIITSINIKNNISKKYNRPRNLQRKKELFNFLKTYRKSLNNVKKLNEVNHYHRYLKKNTKKTAK